MSTGAIIGVIVAVVIVVALVALVVVAQSRSRHLRARFGDEYDRALRERPKREVERELAAREKRHASLDIRPLDPAARERYTKAWAGVQERFVDRPAEAVAEADRLVTELMAERGYPVDGDHEQRFADLSVRHSSTVEHYRQAHGVSTRLAGKDGSVSTEDLREAIVRYRSLFQDLLGDGVDVRGADVRDAEARADRERALNNGHATRTTDNVEHR
ncbi:hypothetical protein V5P93_001241 [Actinokineospora auranticolor]|uniref:Secreted protein n=1 Tax=Actinokineospora auranticolor TaxID=155976 RepID=A0A2S6GUJ9_9PSEU|nr:hypothetical protein [Actinokineospora auranticolor]PPK68869.1 hypothetical protein CLV40_104113 [Actinokineospora auranticolor]